MSDSIDRTVSELMRLRKILTYLDAEDTRDQKKPKFKHFSTGSIERGKKRQTFKPVIAARVYDEPDSEEETEPTDDDERNQKRRRFSTQDMSGRSSKRLGTHLMDHLPPREQQVIHHYYHEIGQKGGKHRGGVGEDESGYDQNVRPGFLQTAPKEERDIVHKFLQAVQTKKNFGEKAAEKQLDRMFSDASDGEDQQQRKPRTGRKNQRRTNLMDHLPLKEQQIIHHYYHEIGQKGGKHRGGESENESGYDLNVRPGFMQTASKEEQEVVHKFLQAVQTKKNFGEKEAEEQLDREFSDAEESQESSQQQKPVRRSQKKKPKQQKGNNAQKKEELSSEQKRLLAEGRRGRKLEGRAYNVRDLKIDQAEKILSSSQDQSRGQKRKRGQSLPEEEEQEEQEDENEDEEGEEMELSQDEEDEYDEETEEETEEMPKKKAKTEPRTEILENMSKKEQEAVLRYYQQVSHIGPIKKIEEYLKSRPADEQSAIKLFVQALQKKRKTSEAEQPKKTKKPTEKVKAKPKKEQVVSKAAKSTQGNKAGKRAEKSSPQKHTSKKGGVEGKEEIPVNQASEETEIKENEPPTTTFDQQTQSATDGQTTILGERASNFVPPSVEEVEPSLKKTPSNLSPMRKRKAET